MSRVKKPPWLPDVFSVQSGMDSYYKFGVDLIYEP